MIGLLLIMIGLFPAMVGFMLITSVKRAKNRAIRWIKALELPITPENVGTEIRVSGTVQPQTGSSPLISPLSMQPCVAWRLDAFSSTYSLAEGAEDSASHDIVCSKEPFCIENKKGERVSVYQEQAHFVFIKLPPYKGAITAEHINHFSNHLKKNGYKPLDTHDIKIQERILPVGMPVYALGTLHQKDGIYYLRPPKNDPNAPVVAAREQDLGIPEMQRLLKLCIGLIATGVVLVVAGVLLL